MDFSKIWIGWTDCSKIWIGPTDPSKISSNSIDFPRIQLKFIDLIDFRRFILLIFQRFDSIRSFLDLILDLVQFGLF